MVKEYVRLTRLYMRQSILTHERYAQQAVQVVARGLAITPAKHVVKGLVAR